MIDCHQNLANAVILCAVKDYRVALKKLNKRPNYGPAKEMKAEVERFFRSEWYRELTSVDGDVLIKQLQMEVRGK